MYTLREKNGFTRGKLVIFAKQPLLIWRDSKNYDKATE